MAAPTPSFIRLADDAALLGAQMRTQSRVVGSDTVHEAFGVDGRGSDVLATYTAPVPSIAGVASAHASTAGFLWLINPVDSPRQVKVRRVEFASSVQALANVIACLTLERVTVTGEHTGAKTQPVWIDTCRTAPVAFVATNTTGLTPSTVEANATIFAYWLTPAITAANASRPKLQEYEPRNTKARILLEPGEGIVLRQITTGSTAMRFNANLAWDEIEP